MDYENDTSWVRGLLRPGENLLWSGRPEKPRLLQKEDLFLVPIGLLLAAFFICVFIPILLKTEKYVVIPLVCVFTLVALWMSLVRPVTRYLGLKKARYALTSQRVVAAQGKKVKSLELLALPPVTVKRRKDGSGSVCFGGGTQSYSYSGTGRFNRGTVTYPPELEFADVPEVDQVENRVRQAAEQAKRAVNMPRD